MNGSELPPALAARARAGELSHAYILCGEDGEGLARAAGAVAAAMVCAGEGGARPCGLCRHCGKVDKGIHPDVITVAPEPGKDITVEQIRTLRRDAYIRPNEAARKVYVVKDAHKMNPNAQNAFLKILEDGPLYAAFLLLTASPAALLPTIRSRCETVTADVPGREPDGELARRGGELAGLLLEGDPWRLVSWCAEREKDKREEVVGLLEEARKALLRYRDEKTTPRAARLALRLRELTVRLAGNANVGCVWGSLWAEAGEKDAP